MIRVQELNTCILKGVSRAGYTGTNRRKKIRWLTPETRRRWEMIDDVTYGYHSLNLRATVRQSKGPVSARKWSASACGSSRPQRVYSWVHLVIEDVRPWIWKHNVVNKLRINIAVLRLFPFLCFSHIYSQLQTLLRNKDEGYIFL